MNLVGHLLDASRSRLATLSQDSPVCDAAAILVNPNTPLVVVCDGEGAVAGVISRTDVVKAFANARADAILASAEAVMTRDVLSCHPHQSLQEVWTAMNARLLRCVPIVDDDGKPQGIIHARDLARALLEEVTHEEILLRDYVLGIGYQ